MLSRSLLLGLLSQSALFPVALCTQCYFTNGSPGTAELEPCFPDQDESLCCGINKTNGDPDDICLSNGMCLAQVTPYTGLVLLNGCTDSTWDSPNCPNPCPNSQKGAFGIHVLPCNSISNEHWCCSASGEDCCDNAFKIEMGTVLLPNSTFEAASRDPTPTPAPGGIWNLDSSTKTVTVTASPTAAPEKGNTTPEEMCHDDSKKLLGVGVGLGVGLAVCLVTSLAALWFQRRMYQRKLQESAGGMTGFLGEKQFHGHFGPPQAPLTELPLTKPETVFEMATARDSVTNLNQPKP